MNELEHTEEEVTYAEETTAGSVASEDSEAPADSRRRLVRLVVLIALVPIVLIAGYFGWRYFSAPADTAGSGDQPTVVSVSTAKAEKKTISQDVSAVGTIFPARQSVVSANVGGQIRGLRILQNQFVKQGELLASVNTSDLEAQKREAEAAFREAQLNIQNLKRSAIPQANIQSEKDLRDARASFDNAQNLYDRRKILYDKGGISLKDLEAAQLSLTQARNNLSYLESAASLRTETSNPLDLKTAEARAAQAQQRIKTLQTQISLAAIRAPISGIVVDQSLYDGEYASPGDKILTIADISEVIVKANFPDTETSNLKQGDPVTVLPSDLAGERMSGKVSLVSRSSDPQNRTTEVWVRLGNGSGRLRSGGSANVIISTNTQKDAIVVPGSAVQLDAENDNAAIIMVVDNGSTAHERKVRIGIRTPELTQVVSGLKQGETVITEGNYALPDGTKVSVKKAKPGNGGGAN